MTEIGVVGCGRWGSLVVRDLVSLGALVHVVARSPESRARAQDAGARTVVGRDSSLPRVDGVVVVAPIAARADILSEVLRRGVPVFTEKPLAVQGATARRLAELADGRLFVMDKWRYHPAVAYLADLARSGELGRPVGLHSRRLDTENSRGEADCVTNLMPHDLCIAQEVLGGIPAPVSAHAWLQEGTVRGMLATFGGDPWLVVEVSDGAPQRTRETTLYLQGGSARVAGDSGHVDIREGARSRPATRPVPGEPPLLAELRAFLHHLEGGGPPRTSAVEASEAVEVMDALRALAGIG